MITEYLKENNLIIVENSLKKKVIEEINNSNKLIDFKVMDINEFINNYYYSYDKKTVYYVLNKLNIKYEIALEYLNSINYVEDKNYNNFKLNKIVELKKELIENNLLITNPNFKYYLDKVNIVIYNYELDPFYLNIFNQYNYSVVLEEYTKKERTVYEFLNIEDEVSYIVSDIKDKLDSGININNIKLVNPSSEYENTIKRIFNWANIPVDLTAKIKLYNLPVSKKIIKLINNNKTFNEIIEIISAYTDSTILNKIINIFNKYVDFDLETSNLLEMIIYDLKNTSISSKHIKNSVGIANFLELNNNNYAYVLGFNKENYPKTHKDEDFLTDKMKEELGLFTSNDKNKIEINNLRKNIYRDVNYIITYKLKTSFDSFNPCILIEEDNLEVIKNKKASYNFSNFYNKYNLAKEYDNYYKYGILNESLKILKSNYKDIGYDTYDNRFTGLDNNKYLESIDKLTLSFSSVDNYFRCGFRYYLSNILKINEESKDEFYMQIGNIFHYVLSKYREENFDFLKYWNEEASKYTFTLDKLIFLDKLKQELKYDIEIIKKQENYTKMHNYLFEKRFYIDVPNNKNKEVVFTGVADKIIYDEINNKNVVSIIDYKTGHLPSNLNNIIYGIGMQLPIYMYLVKNSNLFSNVEIAGFYLQKIINKEIKRTLNKDVDELKEDALKLVGYSNIDTDILSNFDMTFNNSNLISSLKQKNDGSFYSYSKVLDDNELDKIDNIVSSKMTEAANNILDNKFDINPKKIDKDDIGCEFCSYRDICFKKENDYVELKKYNNLEFIRGDDNA